MLDYKKLGFKCGIEIHQQLEGKKLFCACPTINSDKEPTIRIMRKLTPVAGETDEIDRAALHEARKEKYYQYTGHSDDVCLVELDEEPPHEMNKEALITTIQLAKLLNAKIVDEIQVMRKTVIDGSNVSGFQRTSLVATNGYIETSKGKVGIPLISLEEESAQKGKETAEYTEYKLDRLGIPLIEIDTDPDIIDPEHAKETAEKLGLLLRSLKDVKRGIGTIRQDVNVSITGHPRVEIKGFQDLKSIPKVLDFEIQRQLEEMKAKKKVESHVRKAEKDLTTSFLRPMPGSARMYPETDVVPIRPPKDIKGVESLHDKIASYAKMGLAEDMAKQMVKSEVAALFDTLAAKLKNIKPVFIASILLATLKDLKRNGVPVENITERQLESVLSAADNETISKTVVPTVLQDMAEGKFKSLDAYKSAGSADLEKDIKEIVAAKPGLSTGGYMGLIMSKHPGADGKKVMDLLKKYLK